MTLPVIERIAIELADRLNVASMIDFEVVRPDREGSNLSPADRKIVIRQQPQAHNMQLSYMGNPPAVAYDVVFSCVCSVRNVFKDEVAYDTTCNIVASQIIAAIPNPETRPSTWWTFGGLAINSKIGSLSPYITTEGERAGVIVPVLITFRVSETDHTQVRA